uniref:Surfactant protein C n=1 Tax=Anas platyrhynchos TaxID=8839 RepID=A0A8B9SRT9_ANAPL
DDLGGKFLGTEYTASPRLPCVPQQLKSLLMVVVAVVFLVVLVGAFLLLGLHLTETHAETVLRMSIEGLGAQGPPQHLSMSRKERIGTFAVAEGRNSSALLVYDYGKLLVSYRSWLHRVCFITRVDEDNLPGLDAVTEVFQAPAVSPQGEGKAGAEPLADRSILGTTANVLCSSVPIYWT